jgi:geranylgeranyl diphosphate synthase type I
MVRPAARFPPALDEHARAVEEHVDALLEEEVGRWRTIDPALEAPLRALQALVAAGGKRLRPAFALAAYLGAGGDETDSGAPIVRVGAALELLHTFAIVHDDIMDGSDTRRSQPSIHRQFVDEHRARGWRGEPRRFGEGVAILVGDLAFVYADRVLPRIADLLDTWHEMRVELCVGQSLDLTGTVRRSVDLDVARRIAVYKSGKYTAERPLHLGAATAGRHRELAPDLSRLGLPLGAAFQLRDDVLGVFGDELATGKPVGDDLREGKPTPLLALTAARAGAEGEALLARVGAADLDDVEIKQLQDLVLATGALDEVEATIERLVAEARAVLRASRFAAGARELLDDLASYVAWRDR